jgi:2-phospho-L-lactate guanylyltransferase (CobY/MobA/RfbA family)
VDELREQGFEVLSFDRESISVSVDDDGDYVELRLILGGTERTITVEDFEEVYREEG